MGASTSGRNVQLVARKKQRVPPRADGDVQLLAMNTADAYVALGSNGRISCQEYQMQVGSNGMISSQEYQKQDGFLTVALGSNGMISCQEYQK